jgi:hypothetical protein
MGAPVVLPDDEIARTVERFKGYGRNAQEKLDAAKHGARAKRPTQSRATKRPC